MVVPDINNQAENSGRVATTMMMGIAVLVGVAIGFSLIQWVFDTVYGLDAVGIFLLGFAAGLVLIALIGSQLTHVPLWIVLIAGQIVTVLGLLLLII